MSDRPVYRYTDIEMDAIRHALEDQAEDWIDIIWDPITIHFHGEAWHDLAVRGTIEGDAEEFGIPSDQSQQIHEWLAETPPEARMRSFSIYLPSSVQVEAGDELTDVQAEVLAREADDE